MSTRLEFLLHIDGPDGKSVFTLPIGSVTLGRQPGNELTLPDQLVSRQHARIDCTASGCQITDLGSSNGTYVGDQKLLANAPQPLTSGDVIKVGPYRLVVEQVFYDIPPTPEPAAINLQTAGQPENPPGPAADGLRPPVPVLPTGVFSEELPRSHGNGKPALPAECYLVPGYAPDGERLRSYLPGIYHTDFMAGFLAIFESILFPIEWTIDNFDLFLNPATAPAGFFPWLAGWWGLNGRLGWDETQQRQFLIEARKLFDRRGTRWALSRVLEIYTGSEPAIDDTSEDLEPFKFRVRLPAQASAQARRFTRAEIEAVIDAHKPAHTAYMLELIGE